MCGRQQTLGVIPTCHFDCPVQRWHMTAVKHLGRTMMTFGLDALDLFAQRCNRGSCDYHLVHCRWSVRGTFVIETFLQQWCITQDLCLTNRCEGAALAILTTKEHHDRLGAVHAHCDVYCHLSRLVWNIGVGLGIKEHFHDAWMAQFGSNADWGRPAFSISAHRIQVWTVRATCVDQQVHDIRVRFPGGHFERIHIDLGRRLPRVSYICAFVL
mmetsp:Transcript_32399/g.71911  ORF Transcript_32399/g.71911 Transcript_32399/m.71911 type:complete len:213 (+) Transcript_32399:1325-1963(+)